MHIIMQNYTIAMGGCGVMGYWDVGNIVGYVEKGATTTVKRLTNKSLNNVS